jgi:hypothetical protein
MFPSSFGLGPGSGSETSSSASGSGSDKKFGSGSGSTTLDPGPYDSNECGSAGQYCGSRLISSWIRLTFIPDPGSRSRILLYKKVCKFYNCSTSQNSLLIRSYVIMFEYKVNIKKAKFFKVFIPVKVPVRGWKMGWIPDAVSGSAKLAQDYLILAKIAKT